MSVIEINTKSYRYLVNPADEPIARVKPGDDVYICTEDAAEGRIKDKGSLPKKVMTTDFMNPLTGPLYIEGAEKGDTLAVHIHDIEFTRDYAFSLFAEYLGALTSNTRTMMLQEPLKEHVWIWKKADEKGDYWHEEELDITIPKRPFLGIFGVAPDKEAISSIVPGPFGGNMDVADVCPGNTVYLPVYNEGALFYTGDCHAAQGDGELCAFALEIPAKVHLTFDVVKGQRISNPRIENEERIMCVGSARPLEDAVRIAYWELIHWMEDFGFTKEEAYQLCTQVGHCYLGNMVNPLYSMCASIEKKYLVRDKKRSLQE